MQIRFSLVDDDPDVLNAFKLGLQSVPGFTCVGCYASGAEALAGIPRVPGDVVLMDVRMPGMSGIECTRRLKTVLPKLPILMLTGCADDATVHQALTAGASGYLTKPATPRACARAMRAALKGRAPLCWKAGRALVRGLQGAATNGTGDGLSTRERELMTCLFQQLADKEIARQMGVAPGTVHTHLHRIFYKLKVTNRADAVGTYLGGRPGC